MRHHNRAFIPTLITAGVLAVSALTGCGGKSTNSSEPSTTATATTAAPGTTAAATSFCTNLTTAMTGIEALGSGAGASNKNAAGSLFTQLATFLERLAPDAPDNLGPALTTMATSFRKAATLLDEPGGATDNVFADPAYLAATKQFVEYYTTKCAPPSGS